jgi:hypothetical protein
MLALPERPLQISNPPDCLRQLIFESEWDEFPYWMLGTGFLALWENSIFLITAAHPLTHRQTQTRHQTARTRMLHQMAWEPQQPLRRLSPEHICDLIPEPYAVRKGWDSNPRRGCPLASFQD